MDQCCRLYDLAVKTLSDVIGQSPEEESGNGGLSMQG
jgi:hypothetical protein